MSASDPIHDDSVLDEAAAEWLVEREEGFTPERAAAFAEWCSRDPRHLQAVARVERTWALFDELPSVRAPLLERVATERVTNVPRTEARVSRFPKLVWIAGLAAVLAIGLGVWWTAVFRTPPGEHYATDETAQRSLALPDGSTMDMNVESDVTVRLTPRERHVILHRGEAHFQVAHDPARPFIVTAGKVSVRAVGTAFNVRLMTEAVDVVVVEGKVALAQDAAPVPAPSVAAPLLQAGERAQMSRDEPAAVPKIEQIDPAAIRDLLTWSNPMTSFTDIPLRDVVSRFNRQNDTQLVIEDADLGERKIGGMIALDQVEAFVRLLEQDGEIVAERRAVDRIGLRRVR